MSDNMVERVARAIDPDEWALIDNKTAVTYDARGLSLQRARAAIAAMREPTEAMADAPARAGVYAGDYTMHAGEATEAWQAMIDAALAAPDASARGQ